jgi:pyroglutamyl-peptidase
MKKIQLHFGANSGSPRFALENQAVNEATFRCTDELGWKPQVAILMIFEILQHKGLDRH